MKKITCLLSLFLLMMGTAMAQTLVTPDATKVLTAEALRGLTTETPVVLCPVQYSMYGQWYNGVNNGNYATSGATVAEENVFVWVPVLDGTSATGTGYLKKRTASSEDVAYLQPANITTFGAQSSAQVFYPVMPDNSVTEGNTAFGHDNIVPDYTESNLVRLVCGSSEGTAWFNFNGRQYNSGTGIWTAMEVREVSDEEVVDPNPGTDPDPVEVKQITSLSELSNNFAYTLVTQRSQLAVNADGTQLRTAADLHVIFDSKNDQFQFAILKNSKGQYYLYSLKAGKFVTKDKDVLSDDPVNALYFADGMSAGMFTPYFDLSHFLNMGGSKQLTIDGWGPGGSQGSADEGNSYTITQVAGFTPSEELQAKLNSIDVTFRYMVGENEYLAVEKTISAGTVLSEAHFSDLSNDYVSVESWEPTEAITEDATVVTVNCVADELPFVASESVENATWYLVDMHSNDTGDGEVNSGAKNYIWTATTETDAEAVAAAEVTLPKYDAKQAAAFGDNMMWCFVGNVVDGFKIYNKGVGAEYALSKPETGNVAVKLAPVADATPFRLYKSAQITGAACFKTVNDNHYINTQKVGTVKVLRGYDLTDGGSSCRFFAPDHYLLNYAADVNAGPANALGVAQYFTTEGKYEAFSAAVAAANADHFDATATAALSELLTDYASNEENATATEATIADGGYYRLMNVADNTYLAGNAEGNALAAVEAGNGVNSVVKFVANEENYNLSVQGAYVGAAEDLNAEVPMVEETEKAAFPVNHTGCKFTVGTSTEATQYYVLPATTVDVPLNITVNEKTYATAYLPYDVTLPEDATVKAYIVTAAENGMATPAEVADVPSYTGVILEGQTAEVSVATLTLADATAECDDNLLSGSNFSLPVEEEAMGDFYTMSNGTYGVGFYTPADAVIRENSAFLAAEFVTVSDEYEGFLLDLNGQSLPEPVVKEDYALNFDKDASATRTDRYITDITFTAADGEAQTISVNEPKPYVDETATELVCAPGDEIAVEIGFNGSWMHGYVFVDTDNDKQFSFNEGSTDQSGTDVMSFSFYSGDFYNDASGVNSAGTTITGNDRSTMFTPAFTAPATVGTYRIRFKVDWNSVDPGGQLAADGTPTGSNGILANGGMIVDATLNVTDQTGIGAVEATSASKGIYDLSGRRLQKAPAHGVYIQNGKKIVK